MQLTRQQQRTGRGFSLIEMLVVLAILAILMTLIFTPLIGTFNITTRARRTVEVQDAARYASELVTRELGDAMHVVVNQGDYFPFLYYTGGEPGKGDTVAVRGSGYLGVWDNRGNVDNGHDPWIVSGASIDIILPHDTLGLEGGGIQQPLAYEHVTINGSQHPIIVRYFVGLSRPDDIRNGYPSWQNNIITRPRGRENLYTLYRVEFNPYDPHFANWAIPAPGESSPDGREVWRLNPDFFYDPAQVDGHSYAYWWRKKAVAVMPSSATDLVDFVRTNPKDQNSVYTQARCLVSFAPLVMASDTANPVGGGQYPQTFKTQHGHWTGLQNDGTVPYHGYKPQPPRNMLPRIVVYERTEDDDEAIRLTPVFDTAAESGHASDPAKKNRVLAWNSQKGTVEFSMPAKDFEATGDGVTAMFRPLEAMGAALPPGAYISPGSEVVQVEENDGNNRRWVTYSRSDTRDVYETPVELAGQNGQPAQLPAPRTYILTEYNEIIIGYPYPSEQNPVQPAPIPQGHKVRISSFYQNNNPTDMVKVDYQTRTLISVTITAREYDPNDRSALTATVSNRVRLRNIQR
jgi:prepilin-type N-terminal cleavage/methylation domain-containing protein